MKEPFWLKREMILAIHGELLARFGGLSGIRDEGLLESAMNRPIHMFSYNEKPLLTELAAAFTAGLVKHHPFLDGNKRIGFMAAYAFLGINGTRLTASEEAAVIMTRGLAAGEIEESAYAKWLADESTAE